MASRPIVRVTENRVGPWNTRRRSSVVPLVTPFHARNKPLTDQKPAPRSVVYQRPDKKWGWRLKTGNGQVIATDGGQGYENEPDARRMANRIIGGEFKDAETYRAPLKDS